jgi:hypothetical protein
MQAAGAMQPDVLCKCRQLVLTAANLRRKWSGTAQVMATALHLVGLRVCSCSLTIVFCEMNAALIFPRRKQRITR